MIQRLLGFFFLFSCYLLNSQGLRLSFIALNQVYIWHRNISDHVWATWTGLGQKQKLRAHFSWLIWVARTELFQPLLLTVWIDEGLESEARVQIDCKHSDGKHKYLRNLSKCPPSLSNMFSVGVNQSTYLRFKLTYYMSCSRYSNFLFMSLIISMIRGTGVY